MIWDNILRVENISEVHKVMQFNYCMPEQVSYDGETLENMQAAIWVKQTESLVFYQEFLENRNCDIVLIRNSWQQCRRTISREYSIMHCL